MNPIKTFTAIGNLASTRALRSLLLLGSVGVMGLPALAASAGNSAAQSTQAQRGQPQGQPQAPAGQPGRQRGAPAMNLEVSYYSGDPLKGGKLITTLKLTPPQNQGAPALNRAPSTAADGQISPAAGQRPVNPVVAQAPAGATYAVIKDDHGGARIIDLSQADQMMGGFGGRGGPQDQGGQTPPPRR
ncbi:hypothetical protein DKM44_09965 [Deinococcus irradiatisoli]|uniref:Uncharacterized protein n=1 Tax=Deinococcus irradiatisoli TaxID=2202254 RepID=A0A2Z3JKR7_9DEIO|nr:hypothetical protein [Deinococcus irradiatisoli]AWN23509.1 hypothetical protein DKM44_09965 [Deinococcus irradiatisoli]